jgi:DNA-3-methyladenine glycosylase II
VPVLAVPQPYEFEHSTERFRVFGSDRATVWHEGGLHRVIGGREVRIEPVAGGVRVEPGGAEVEGHVAHLLGLPFDLGGFWDWAARSEPVLAGLEEPLHGYRPPLAPDAWEALVTAITAQQVSLFAACAVRGRFVERFGDRHDVAWAFPSRERVARAEPEDVRIAGFSYRKAEYVISLARADLDLDSLATLDDNDVISALTTVRGLGRWSAEWFLARVLARADAWPAGDLGLRKAVSRFYGDGSMLTEAEVRSIGERFSSRRNLTAHALLAAARLYG